MINLQRVADISVLAISGDLDKFEGRQLFKSISRLIQNEWVKIVLDFERVEHINYQILAELVSMAVASHTLRGEIKLSNMSPYHQNLLRVAGVNEFFDTYGSLAEAILSFEDAYTPSASFC